MIFFLFPWKRKGVLNGCWRFKLNWAVCWCVIRTRHPWKEARWTNNRMKNGKKWRSPLPFTDWWIYSRVCPGWGRSKRLKALHISYHLLWLSFISFQHHVHDCHPLASSHCDPSPNHPPHQRGCSWCWSFQLFLQFVVVQHPLPLVCVGGIRDPAATLFLVAERVYSSAAGNAGPGRESCLL